MCRKFHHHKTQTEIFFARSQQTKLCTHKLHTAHVDKRQLVDNRGRLFIKKKPRARNNKIS